MVTIHMENVEKSGNLHWSGKFTDKPVSDWISAPSPNVVAVIFPSFFVFCD